MALGIGIVVLLGALQAAHASPTPTWGLPLVGDQAENFLRTANIVSIEYLHTKGVTHPQLVVLSDGTLELKAVFKTIDEYATVKHLAGGETELRFSDSYRYEIAAYELDKLLGLGIVPPTVKRRIGKEVGSLSLWVEGAITEWERLNEKDIHDPDTEAWNNQMFTVRLFLQLTYDTDYHNIRNLLVTPDFNRNYQELRREEALERFSRPVVKRLRALTLDDLRENLGPWLSKAQINALWARRNLILELVDRRIAEQGEAAVLFD
ncbi:MAG: hypothetical protein P8Y93_10720 [Acidobacteriota bacterium]